MKTNYKMSQINNFYILYLNHFFYSISACSKRRIKKTKKFEAVQFRAAECIYLDT